MKHIWIALGLCLAAATGCGGKQAEIKEDRLTVGRVQGEVKMGMSAAQVAELLGSPNIVTTDDKRREVWIYDKVSTDRVDTSSSPGSAGSMQTTMPGSGLRLACSPAMSN